VAADVRDLMRQDRVGLRRREVGQRRQRQHDDGTGPAHHGGGVDESAFRHVDDPVDTQLDREPFDDRLPAG
jgi:hypothetical protein